MSRGEALDSHQQKPVTTIADRADVLQYAEPDTESNESNPFFWPVLLGLLQFVWLPICAGEVLGWDRIKRPIWDTLFFIMMAAPSLTAAAMTFYVGWRHAYKRRKTAPLVVCVIIGLVSAAVGCGIIELCIQNVLLDPQGRWYPL
jgi:hypothetical protein